MAERIWDIFVLLSKLKDLLTYSLFKSEGKRSTSFPPKASLTVLLVLWGAQRFSGIHHCSFFWFLCVTRFACGSDFFQETPFEYAEGGHGGSGTQGTLWSLQIWGPFFLSWGWASHRSLALPDVWRPGSFLCLILLSPLVIASVLSVWSLTWSVSGHQ